MIKTALCLAGMMLALALVRCRDSDLSAVPQASPPADPAALDRIDPPDLLARHVVLISLDTLRSDFLGFMGNEWIHTPRFDSLAEESIVFTNHETVVTTTLASHTTIFTGLFPHHHGTPGNG